MVLSIEASIAMLRAVIMSSVLAVLLAGCGVRGPLEAPPGAVADPDATTAPAPAGRPAKSFVLDGLL
jgi:predicted small lipoprotein YifL